MYPARVSCECVTTGKEVITSHEPEKDEIHLSSASNMCFSRLQDAEGSEIGSRRRRTNPLSRSRSVRITTASIRVAISADSLITMLPNCDYCAAALDDGEENQVLEA